MLIRDLPMLDIEINRMLYAWIKSLSTIHSPLSTSLSTIHSPLSTLHYPLSTLTLHYSLSTLHSSGRVGESQVNLFERQAGRAVGMDPDGELIGSLMHTARRELPIHPGRAAGTGASGGVIGG